MGGDPLERNWVEVRILNRLNDRGHAVSLLELRNNLVPNMEETIVCTVFNLKDEGLVTVFEVPGGKMVDITAHGRDVLLKAISNRNRCD
jgi:CTP-dependent riboflavin kinase